MSNVLTRERLIRVSKAGKELINNWEEGVSLKSDSRCNIQDLMIRVARDRWRLAVRFRKDAGRMIDSNPPLYCSAVGRGYYAMYHAMRAVAYIHHNGDDHGTHATLPAATPGDFPNKDFWQNELKNGRETRNRADYDPYPKTDLAWKKTAIDMKNKADKLILLTRNYLRSKGVNQI